MKYNPIKLSLKYKSTDDKGFDNSLLDYEDFNQSETEREGKGVNISNSF